MPDWKSLLNRRLREISVDSPLNDDVVDELIAHLQDRYDEHRSAGLQDEEAIQATLKEVDENDLRDAGAWTRRQTARRPPNPEPERSGSPIIDFWRDARYGARLLVRNPRFTVTVVTTLAFGIAANTIAFTLIATLLLRPLPLSASRSWSSCPRAKPRIRRMPIRTFRFRTRTCWTCVSGTTCSAASPATRPR
jgi:hypothetical protein